MRMPALRFGLIIAVAAAFAFFAMHPALAQTTGSNQSLDLGDQMLSMFSAVALYVAEALGKFVIAILDITIPLMRYQGFTSSPVVNAGWAIVRDVVNMFFVVVLIIIAMGTIFGSSRFQWKQQVPRLMIFAIVINFSKTLCGIMIDFAQVIMLTFANALKDIAGGNFIQLLGLGDMFSLSDKADAIAGSTTGGDGIGPFDFFVASAAAVFMMVWVLAVVMMLMVILVYRVVMLWILIVLAPLAWFLGGQSILKTGAESYAEWWKNFICYTAIGPVITFFLWLTLAVAGSGFIAANDPGLSSLSAGGDAHHNLTGIAKIFEFERLLSFVIGMAMMMVGFDAAAKICHGVKKAPGFDAVMGFGKGGGAINRYLGRQGSKYGGKALSSGFAGGKSFAAGAGVGLLGAAVGGGTAAERLQRIAPTRAGQAARAEGLRNLSKSMPGALSGTARSLSMAADARQSELAETMKKAAEEQYKGASDETKVDQLIRLAKGGGQAFENAENMGLLAEGIKNSKMREKLEAAGVLGTLVTTQLPGLKKQLKGTKDYDAINEFEAGRPDLTGNFTGINSEDDLRKLDPSALANLRGNAAFRAQIGTFKTGVRNTAGTDNLTGLEYFDTGHGSAKQVRAWEDGMEGVYTGMGNQALALVPDASIAEVANDALIRRHAVATGRPDSAARAVAAGGIGARERMVSSAALSREVTTRAFGTSTPAGMTATVDRRRVDSALKSNQFAVKNVNRADMNGDMAEAVADAYSKNATLEALADQYLVSNPDEREEMDASIISNVLESFDAAESAATAAGDTTRAAAMAGQRTKLLTELETIEGGNASMITRIDARLTSLRTDETRLASVRRPSAGQARQLARVRDDLSRLTARRSMH